MKGLLMLIPRQPAPALSVSTIAHGDFDLTTQKPPRFTLVVFYRGLHCPICASYLKELARLIPSFAERGVQPIAISSDTQERAQQMAEKIGDSSMRLGWGLKLKDARRWGLYLSASRGKTSLGIEEPPLFSEPGVFLVRPDHSIYYASVQSMPFVRPQFRELLQALDFIIQRDYPARGEHIEEV